MLFIRNEETEAEREREKDRERERKKGRERERQRKRERQNILGLSRIVNTMYGHNPGDEIKESTQKVV